MKATASFEYFCIATLPLAIAETVKRNPGDIRVGFFHELDPKHCIGKLGVSNIQRDVRDVGVSWLIHFMIFKHD